LPVDLGRHRVLRLAFEERVEWRYQLPHLEPENHGHQERPDSAHTWEYRPLETSFWLKHWFYQFMGWQPTRIRFLAPSAENCASYHFEFTAPEGVWVTSAAFVAGRPNLEDEGATPWDSVTSTGHSAGLHVVEVPNGSLCRAQINLRVPSRGWLSTLTVSCWAVVVVLAAAAWHARLLGTPGQWTPTQVTNIVLLLVTVCGGASTYVAQHSAGDVAARMLSGLRILGVVVLSLPAVAAVSLVFLRDHSAGSGSSGEGGALIATPAWMTQLLPSWLLDLPNSFLVRDLLVAWLLTLTGLGFVAALAVTTALISSRVDERRSGRDSPWDMTTVQQSPTSPRQRKARGRKRPIPGEEMSFHDLLTELHLNKKAIGVYSAEGWHERYGWDDRAQQRALKKLDPHGGADARNPTACRCQQVRDHSPARPPEVRARGT
jgi:hypothetical protein